MPSSLSSPETKAERMVVEFHEKYQRMKGIRNGCLWNEFLSHLLPGEEDALAIAISDGNLSRVYGVLEKKQGYEYSFMTRMIKHADLILAGRGKEINPRRVYKSKPKEPECVIVRPAEKKNTPEVTTTPPKKKQAPQDDLETLADLLAGKVIKAIIRKLETL